VSSPPKSPLVSICIPAYARPAELGEAIASVISQSYGDLEVLVGDDSGGLDTVVAKAGDPRVVYIRNEQRLGMARNYNALLDRARGRYIGILDDDDRLLPTFVERVVERFEQDPELGVVFTDHLFDEGGRLRPRQCAVPGGRHDDFLRVQLTARPVHCSASLYRRDVWERIRPLPDLIWADIVMQTRAAEEGYSFFYVDEPLMIYRVHPGGLSRQAAIFRDHAVAAWELFNFTDPECERLRLERMARALCGRAAHHLKTGSLGEARADAERARSIAEWEPTVRERLITFLACHARSGASAAWLWARVKGQTTV